jgi:hemin uptake protein HemP
MNSTGRKSTASKVAGSLTDLQPSEAIELRNTPHDAHSDSSQSVEFASSTSPKFPKIIPFDVLARCGEEIWIENKGQIYRLRRTKQGKLILTK